MTEEGRIEFKIKFDGQLIQVDANTLINGLLHFTSILQAVNREVSPHKKINIRVNAFDELGSFPVSLELIEMAEALIAPEGIEYVKNILEITVLLYAVKKLLKGEKAKDIEKKEGAVIIENNEGVKIIVNETILNIYTKNDVVNEALIRNFETLADDPSIAAFEITDKLNKRLFEIPREEFNDMATKNDMLICEDTRTRIKEASLHIFKLVFDEKRKWEFYYKGNKISANIVDKDFFEAIDSGESFTKGDTMVVDLEIEQVFDEKVNTYVNKAYRILKVKKHIPRAQQEDFIK